MESNDFVRLSAYWTGAEYAGEGSPAKAFFHGGFGILGFDAIRKPRYWAFFLLRRLGTERLALEGVGEGFGTLVNGWATRSGDGSLRVLLSNVTYEQTRPEGDPSLTQHITLNMSGLATNRTFLLRHFRVDNTHSNVYAAWRAQGGAKWPDRRQLAALHGHDTLDQFEPDRTISTDSQGNIEVMFEMPMPSLSMLEVTPLDSRE